MLLAQRLLDTLLPPRCVLCGEGVETQGSLCGVCWGRLHFISEPFCAKCSLPFEFDPGTGALCGACLEHPPSYAAARAALSYDEASRPLVARLKYYDQTYLARGMAAWLMRAGREVLEGADLLAPVPLHYYRLIRRTYNQSGLLARWVGEASGIPVIPDLLTRKKHTAPQASLSRDKRRKNVRGAFTITPRHKERVAGKRIVLVDDVMTTGATVEACSKALLKAGAASVHVLALARTSNT